jgi:beta-phosphoglucomutase-like phosphatase (HAD superfamily)
MKLAVFDLDGTLTDHVDADEKCFVQAFADAYGIDQLDRHWMDYEHVTDSWVVAEVFRTKYGRTPEPAEILRYVECYLSLLTEALSQRRALMRVYLWKTSAVQRAVLRSNHLILVVAS